MKVSHILAAAVSAVTLAATNAVAQPYVIAAAGGNFDERHVIPVAGSTDADALKGSLCTGEDWVVFSGTSQKNGKIVSICMMEGDDEMPSHLTYRFGTPGNVEMIWPKRAKGSARQFTLRVYTRPRTTYVKFEFETGGYEYAILEGSDGNETDASLRVTRLSDDKVVAEHPLTLLNSELMMLDGLVRTAPFDE